MYVTDSTTHHRFLKMLRAIQEPFAAVRVTEHSLHKVDNFYRRELLTDKKH